MKATCESDPEVHHVLSSTPNPSVHTALRQQGASYHPKLTTLPKEPLVLKKKHPLKANSRHPFSDEPHLKRLAAPVDQLARSAVKTHNGHAPRKEQRLLEESKWVPTQKVGEVLFPYNRINIQEPQFNLSSHELGRVMGLGGMEEVVNRVS